MEDGHEAVDHLFMLVGRAEAPGLPPGVLRRGRLADLLTTAASNRLTLVSAGPSWGKTIAAAWWAVSGSAQCPVAWLNLNDSDNNPRSFWLSLVSAMVANGAVRGGGPLLGYRPAGQFDDADADELLVQLAELPVPVVLVIDDFQVITHDRGLGQFGRFIAELPPSSLRLVLLTHHDPVLPLHVLRVRGDVTEIRAAYLAFTAEETAELFNSNDFRLQANQVGRIMDHTGGWPAGVRAAALSINPLDVDVGITRFCSASHGVADDFINDVLQAVSPMDREFLLPRG